MKILFYTVLGLILSSTLATAQTGVYHYQNKAKQESIELNLRRDGVFFLTQDKTWNHCVTQGKWRPLGHGKVSLTSNYQLDDYQLEETEDSSQTGITLVIQGASKGQGPTSISRIFMNENETASFEIDGEAGLAMLEQRQRLLSAGSTAVRDSLKKSDPQRFYHYPTNKKLRSITLEFDQKELTIAVKNPKANKLVLTTSFAPNAAYYYLKEAEFIQSGKFIYEAGKKSIQLKKQRP